jgi:type VI secretion system protein ImpH
VDDHAKLANAGHLVRVTRNAEGLASLLRGFFSMPVRIVEYCCRWLAIAPDQRTRLGIGGPGAMLGAGAVAGNAVFDGQSSFRVELGPMRLADYEQFLPGGRSFAQLVAWLRNYIGVELDWRARLVLAKDEVPPPMLGQRIRLGWTTWIGARPQRTDADDLVLDAERWTSRVGPALNPS